MDYKLIAQIIIIISIIILIYGSIRIILGRYFGLFGLFFCIYHILFYAFPALFHIGMNRFPFFSMSYDEGIILIGAFFTFLFVCFWFFGYFIAFNSLKVHNLINSLASNRMSMKKINVGFTQLVIIFLLCVQIVGIAIYGVDSFTARRGEFDSFAFGDSSHFQTLIINLFRGVSFICLLVSIFFMKSLVFRRWFFILLSLSLFFIINNPFSLARFQFFSYILGFIFIKYNTTKKLKFIIFCISVIGVVTVFPFSSHVTRGEGEYIFSITEIIDYYCDSGDFDGFQSFLNIIIMTSKESFSYGYQFLGAILAFVPRVYWLDKPESTGVIAAEYMGYSFTNISAPFISELYVDFGIIGIVIGATLLGYLFRFLDVYSNFKKVNGQITDIFVIAILFSFVVILLRGALISVISPLFIEVTILVFILRIILYTPTLTTLVKHR